LSTQVCSSSAPIGGTTRKLKFGPFELSSRANKERVLWHEGVVLPLGRKSLDILIYLAERPDEIVAEKALRDRAWSGAAIERASLRVHMAVIGKALGERPFGSRYISNVGEEAYSFVGSVVSIG
jgi:DNA-binding winged helix-turn-helix (wHTH) protein